jgi:DNA-binding SARP family transcriptional activator
MPPVLRIRLLGGFDLRIGDTPLPPIASARVRSLLSYLLLHRSAPLPRQHLAFLLWPDSTEAQARTNLRHLLHTLQRAAPALMPYLQVAQQMLHWRTDAAYWLDVAAFEDALARAEQEPAAALAALCDAVACYRGDLVPDCYDEWIEPERERLRRRYVHALQRLSGLLEAAGEHTQAIACAEQLLGCDPLEEAAYRLLMRRYFAHGDRARALRTYYRCVATLERELAAEPSAATRELYEALLLPEPQAVLAAPDGHGGTPPLVGRAAEWQQLASLWRAAERGHPQLALVTGEAGIGKTRLLEELRAWCKRRGAAIAEARSYPAEGVLAYGPVVAWLRSGALGTLEPGQLGSADLSEIARLLPELLAGRPALARPEPLPESEQRTRMFAAVTRAILSAGGPLLLIVDDVHWSDRETLHFLHHLLRAATDEPLLVAATARSEEVHERHPLHPLVVGLRRLGRIAELELARFTLQETAAIGERLAGYPLDAAGASELHAQTEGNPLFIVEALRAGWRSGRSGFAWNTPKVQAVIQHRLAQLSEPARQLAGIAATVGREFTTDVLASSSDIGEETLIRGLDELWRTRIVRERGAGAYDFSHDKIREVAYHALSPARRRQNHRSVAKALQRLHAGDVGPVSGQIAAHYQFAGMIEDALGWYEAAAEAAQRVCASGDAVRLLRRALELVETLPAAPERDVRALATLTASLTPLANAEGFASPTLHDAQRRALELARRLGVEPPAHLLGSLAIASLCRNDFDAAQQFGERLQARGYADQDQAVLIESAYVLGIAAFWQGQFAVARRHFEAASEGYRPARRRAHLLRYWLDPQVVCLSRLGNTLWFLGETAAAVRARDAALALADEIAHPFTRSAVITFAALLALEMDDTPRIREYLDALEPASEDRDAGPTSISAELLRSYLRALDGEATGIAQLWHALDEAEGAEGAEGAPGFRAVVARLLMAACAATGDLHGRLAAAEHMLRRSGTARVWESEARRTRAECLAALGAAAVEVEAELERAVDVARRQGARALEQKAAARLRVHRASHASHASHASRAAHASRPSAP